MIAPGPIEVAALAGCRQTGQTIRWPVERSAGLHALRDEYTRAIEPARTLAAETLKLERALSDLVNQAYGLTPAEIALMWKTAPPRMPIPAPGGSLPLGLKTTL